jgi:hypothetical protein
MLATDRRAAWVGNYFVAIEAVGMGDADERRASNQPSVFHELTRFGLSGRRLVRSCAGVVGDVVTVRVRIERVSLPLTTYIELSYRSRLRQ